MIKTCEHCKKIFETDISKQIYCSKKCSVDDYREKHRKEKEKIIKKCAVCGEFFEADRENAVCCSEHCRKIRIRLKTNERDEAERKRQRTTRKKKTNTQKLIEDAAKAKEAGLTYGQWQARQYAERERQ